MHMFDGPSAFTGFFLRDAITYRVVFNATVNLSSLVFFADIFIDVNDDEEPSGDALLHQELLLFSPLQMRPVIFPTVIFQVGRVCQSQSFITTPSGKAGIPAFFFQQCSSELGHGHGLGRKQTSLRWMTLFPADGSSRLERTFLKL